MRSKTLQPEYCNAVGKHIEKPAATLCYNDIVHRLHSPMKMKKTAKKAMSKSDWKKFLD